MGNSNNLPTQDTEDAIALRSELSDVIREKRKKRRKIFASMTYRILSTEEYSSISFYTDSSIILTSNFDVVFLPERAIMTIVQMIADEYSKLLLVSPMWYLRIHESFDESLRHLENSFILVHSNLLLFDKSITTSQRINTVYGMGLRIDRVIMAEVLPALLGTTVKIQYTYSYLNDAELYHGEFKFDVIRKGQRVIWVHKDEYNPQEKKAYTSQIISVCIGDRIEIAVTLFNQNGIVDLERIHFNSPVIVSTKEILNGTQLKPQYDEKADWLNDLENYGKKLYLYNIARHCEFELSMTEWYDANYYENEPIVTEHFSPFLKLVSSEYAGVEIQVLKNTYEAWKAGIIYDSLQKIGIQVEVVEASVKVTEEVKRMGWLFDRDVGIQLRVGDQIVLYISREIKEYD